MSSNMTTCCLADRPMKHTQPESAFKIPWPWQHRRPCKKAILRTQFIASLTTMPQQLLLLFSITTGPLLPSPLKFPRSWCHYDIVLVELKPDSGPRPRSSPTVIPTRPSISPAPLRLLTLRLLVLSQQSLLCLVFFNRESRWRGGRPVHVRARWCIRRRRSVRSSRLS